MSIEPYGHVCALTERAGIPACATLAFCVYNRDADVVLRDDHVAAFIDLMQSDTEIVFARVAERPRVFYTTSIASERALYESAQEMVRNAAVRAEYMCALPTGTVGARTFIVCVAESVA